ncbi:putative disease resistance RPP13-like protein 1 [Lactuca sativa]|uniref:putative disease resistance RPP13-like protein 1 n=1 Tax=Lactuca sativa TaxID=4236 RepID=UPI000CC969A8|nr:putative disease resistance RPP13-like protein 1 [Lactuca sativa]
MAEIVVSAVITVLCEKLISGDLMKLARTEGIDSQLHKLEKTLPLMKAVLADANQKHITERAVQLWLNDLQDLAYDIDDIVDDLATEALRRSLNQEALAIIPSCCTTFTPGNIMYGPKMRSELDEITAKLRDLVDRKNDLGLNVSVERSNITERRLEQTSLVDESKIIGREGDKEALLKKLLGKEECDENVSIVSIVGMGGIGKTTLAKLLYNEEKVKDHFELRAWVCASEELDVFNISKAIFEAVGGDAKRLSNLDLLHVALKEKLLKKRFLLVLDDVWNEDYNKWELLQSPLLVGAPGSRVLVTTRSTKVASVMDSEEAFDLEVLSNDDALSLFAKHALGEKNFDKHPTLKLLGEGIVKKCGRLPLALKTLGWVLKGNRNADEWEKLLNTEIWNINDGSEILPALRLSYYHLPSHLKLLFAYCSLFPKDYEFQKNDLILLWMAEGFLSQSDDNNQWRAWVVSILKSSSYGRFFNNQRMIN